MISYFTDSKARKNNTVRNFQVGARRSNFATFSRVEQSRST